MKQMVEIYIKLAELEVKREVNVLLILFPLQCLHSGLISHLEILDLLG